MLGGFSCAFMKSTRSCAVDAEVHLGSLKSMTNCLLAVAVADVGTLLMFIVSLPASCDGRAGNLLVTDGNVDAWTLVLTVDDSAGEKPKRYR